MGVDQICPLAQFSATLTLRRNGARRMSSSDSVRRFRRWLNTRSASAGSSIDRSLIVARSRETLTATQLFGALVGVGLFLGVVIWTVTSLDAWFKLWRCMEAGHRNCIVLDMNTPQPPVPRGR